MTVNYKTYKFKQTQSINLEEKDLEEKTTRRNLTFGFLPDGTDDIPEITYSGTVIYNDERDPKPIEGKVSGSSFAVVVNC
nr:hypothetical protein PJ912_21745 [Pectobacterium colocasium]